MSTDFFCSLKSNKIFLLQLLEKVNDAYFLEALKEVALESKYCLSVCTGSVLLAKCGILDGKKVTLNKMELC